MRPMDNHYSLPVGLELQRFGGRDRFPERVVFTTYDKRRVVYECGRDEEAMHEVGFSV